MIKTSKSFLLENISKVQEKRRIYETILNDKDKINEFINEYPYFFSVLYHSFNIDMYAFSDHFIPQTDYHNWIDDESFMVVAIDLYIEDLSKYLNDEEENMREVYKLRDLYMENLYDKWIKKELDKLEKNCLINKFYDEYNADIIYFILYPLDVIIKVCIEDKELYKILEKVKKKSLLNFTLKEGNE